MNILKEEDFREVPHLAKLVNKVDNMNAGYMNEMSDDIFQKQPFFLSVLLGYRLDISMPELDEIIKIYFLVWEYFRHDPKVQTIKITQEYYKRTEDKLIAMLQYIEGETSEIEKTNIYNNDLANLRSKALYTAVLFRMKERPILHKMNGRVKGLITIGIKTFITCFENCGDEAENS